MKFTISDHPQPIDPLLKNCIGKWRQQILLSYLGKCSISQGTVASVAITVNIFILREVKRTKVIVSL